ncbi:hypothetical protein PuT2_15090 [Pusillimonas sp. T2]|nr:hypothetical protein PuT2_15090 [Pusillimonas sp. T2]
MLAIVLLLNAQGSKRFWIFEDQVYDSIVHAFSATRLVELCEQVSNYNCAVRQALLVTNQRLLLQVSSTIMLQHMTRIFC